MAAEEVVVNMCMEVDSCTSAEVELDKAVGTVEESIVVAVRTEADSIAPAVADMAEDSSSNRRLHRRTGMLMYLMYRNVYPCWPFIIGAIALNLVAIFGMVTNLGVIWTTYCTKTLHGTANVLLALCSFFELLHQQGHLLFLYVALSGQNFISLSMAIRWCTVSLFALGGITLSMTFTGLDRLLCVLFPTFPNKVKPLPYLGVIITLCVIFSLQNVMNFYELASTMPFLMVPGTIGDLMKGDASQSLAIKSLILNTITIFLYVIVGIVISKKSVRVLNCPMRKCPV
uniref:Uncharacterized protein n=1 Tax=Globodera rostochiensis TaxID=31243 RepID=A0A914ICE6_GLORO